MPPRAARIKLSDAVRRAVAADVFACENFLGWIIGVSHLITRMSVEAFKFLPDCRDFASPFRDHFVKLFLAFLFGLEQLACERLPIFLAQMRHILGRRFLL